METCENQTSTNHLVVEELDNDSIRILLINSSTLGRIGLSGLPTPPMYPSNTLLAKRIDEREWGYFFDALNALYAKNKPSPLWFLYLLMTGMKLTKCAYFNALFETIAVYNKYLFMPRGIQVSKDR